MCCTCEGGKVRETCLLMCFVAKEMSCRRQGATVGVGEDEHDKNDTVRNMCPHCDLVTSLLSVPSI